MGTLLVVLLVAVAAWIGWTLWKKPDANEDGKVDHADALVAAQRVAAEAKAKAASLADVNKDGKVDLADAKEAVAKVKKGRKKKAE
jgi:predicted negative regulator of RcsB-dependent stress response